MVDSFRHLRCAGICRNINGSAMMAGSTIQSPTDITVTAPEELKGIEYGCTVDAVSLLIPAMQRKRGQSMPLVGTD